jgi:hypothetical protein
VSAALALEQIGEATESHITWQEVSRLEIAHALFDGVVAVFASYNQPAIRPVPKGIDRLGVVVISGGHEQKQNTIKAGQQAQCCHRHCKLASFLCNSQGAVVGLK